MTFQTKKIKEIFFMKTLNEKLLFVFCSVLVCSTFICKKISKEILKTINLSLTTSVNVKEVKLNFKVDFLKSFQICLVLES